MTPWTSSWTSSSEHDIPRLAGRRVWAVEGNATAQFAGFVRAAGALGDFEPVLRYDGLPFTGEEIAGRVSR